MELMVDSMADRAACRTGPSTPHVGRRRARTFAPWWTGLVALVMIAFAGYEIAARLDRPLRGGWS